MRRRWSSLKLETPIDFARPPCAGARARASYRHSDPSAAPAMDQIEIHRFSTEPTEAVVEGAQGFVEALVIVPQLGGDEDVAPGHRLFHAFLVAVGCGGVDGEIAGFEGCAHHPRRVVRRRLPDAEPKLGHPSAIVQGDVGLVFHQVLREGLWSGPWPAVKAARPRGRRLGDAPGGRQGGCCYSLPFTVGWRAERLNVSALLDFHAVLPALPEGPDLMFEGPGVLRLLEQRPIGLRHRGRPHQPAGLQTCRAPGPLRGRRSSGGPRPCRPRRR